MTDDEKTVELEHQYLDMNEWQLKCIEEGLEDREPAGTSTTTLLSRNWSGALQIVWTERALLRLAEIEAYSSNRTANAPHYKQY
ncbi:hypothetical protein [Pelodictyon luteolum]|uniref:hypothetical protein n=1 Tax=Pelodictyon luteolum TaxID=1100 RepID=UPI00059D2276|nr:hypothetical protein [Pelodictyon luteolum]